MLFPPPLNKYLIDMYQRKIWNKQQYLGFNPGAGFCFVLLSKQPLPGFPIVPAWTAWSHKLPELDQDIATLRMIPMHAHDSDYQMLSYMGQLGHVCGTLAV